MRAPMPHRSRARAAILPLLLTGVLTGAAAGAAPPTRPEVDEQVIGRIKEEGFQRSQAMETLHYLADVYGPRLKGSPAFRQSAEWVRSRLNSWGIDRVWFEPGGFTAKSWVLDGYSAEMTIPGYERLNAQPLAWSPSTNGVVSGEPMLVEIGGPEDFERYRGKLRGRIVLNAKHGVGPTENLPDRYTEAELAAAGRTLDPNSNVLQWDNLAPYGEMVKRRRERIAQRAALARFFRDEGVAALLIPSVRDNEILHTDVFAADAGGFDPTLRVGFNFPVTNLAAPTFILSREDFGRISRLLQHKNSVDLRLSLAAHDVEPQSVNVIAEIPGSGPLRDQVVMLGGHLDAWHFGTGATDNGAGCAIAMEAMRILKASGAKPRRTIRMALWDAEEGGLTGSMAYVRRHFADPDTMALLPEHAKLSAYFNLDHGAGRIRGIFLQGNEAVRPIFERWLEPYAYLGATTLSVQSIGQTDHASFDYVGLPAFQFIQDDVGYRMRLHHSNLDVYEHVSSEDVRQAAVIVASLVLATAMRDELLPRKPLPAPAR